MFTHQALPPGFPTPFVNEYETSAGRAAVPLGATPGGVPPYSGKAQADGPTLGTEDPRVDQWHNQLVYEPVGGSVNMEGFGEAPQPAYVAAPELERRARFFVTYFYHPPYQGGEELRENVGGHVVIRRMPNAGQAQGGLQPLSTGQYQPNQRRVQPPAWDAGAFIG